MPRHHVKIWVDPWAKHTKHILLQNPFIHYCHTQSPLLDSQSPLHLQISFTPFTHLLRCLPTRLILISLLPNPLFTTLFSFKKKCFLTLSLCTHLLLNLLFYEHQPAHSHSISLFIPTIAQVIHLYSSYAPPLPLDFHNIVLLPCISTEINKFLCNIITHSRANFFFTSGFLTLVTIPLFIILFFHSTFCVPLSFTIHPSYLNPCT